MSLSVEVIVSTDFGGLNLNSEPYKVAGNSFESESVTHRKLEVTNPFLEGTYVIHSLRENITTPLSVYVEATDHVQMLAAMDRLREAFDQVQFTVTVVMNGHARIWNCYASDYTVNTQRELLHADRARIDVQLVRDPKEVTL